MTLWGGIRINHNIFQKLNELLSSDCFLLEDAQLFDDISTKSYLFHNKLSYILLSVIRQFNYLNQSNLSLFVNEFIRYFELVAEFEFVNLYCFDTDLNQLVSFNNSDYLSSPNLDLIDNVPACVLLEKRIIIDSEIENLNTVSHFLDTYKSSIVNKITIPIIHDENCLFVLECVNSLGDDISNKKITYISEILDFCLSIFFRAHTLYFAKKDQDDQALIKENIKKLAAEVHFYPLISKIITCISEICDVERASVFLFDNETQKLWLLDGTGDVKNKLTFDCRLGIAGKVFSTQQPAIVLDVYGEQDFNPEFEQKVGFHTQNMICYPMIHSSGKCIGVVQAINKNKGVFSKRDLKKLAYLVDFASISIENARLFDSDML